MKAQLFNFEKFEGEMFEILRSTAQKFVNIQRSNSREFMQFCDIKSILYICQIYIMIVHDLMIL